MALQTASMVRSPALRNRCLSLAKSCSMGGEKLWGDGEGEAPSLLDAMDGAAPCLSGTTTLRNAAERLMEVGHCPPWQGLSRRLAPLSSGEPVRPAWRASALRSRRLLARRCLKGGTLVLYDVSSSYLEGRCRALAKRGYNRDGKKGKPRIVYGLLCAADGCPVAIEVFDGNTADPATLASQISKLKQRFGVSHVVLVGDRGMITQARISDDVKPAGLDWITALRAPSIKALAEAGALQLSLFDDRDMATITSPDFPGERLIVCIKVGVVLDRHKMAKHFDLAITDNSFRFARKTKAIARRGDARRHLRGPHQPARRYPR